jgi:hypothetical protein
LPETSRAKVIPVDFAARRRVQPLAARRPVPPPTSGPAAAVQALLGSLGFLVFWRPPLRRSAGEYLGGRWDWGWTLFVWTSDAAVGPVWDDLVRARGYLPQRLTRQGFMSFLRREKDVGGLLIDGELDGDGQVIRAEPDQLVPRAEAISTLGP